jgi:hypothetical protein
MSLRVNGECPRLETPIEIFSVWGAAGAPQDTSGATTVAVRHDFRSKRVV